MKQYLMVSAQRLVKGRLTYPALGPRLRNGETERTDVMGYVVQSSFGELATALDMLAPKNERGIQHRVGFLADQLVPSGDNYRFYQLKYVRL
jgi:hypothetical protein